MRFAARLEHEIKQTHLQADGGGDELVSIAEGQIHLGEASLQEEERTKKSLQYENDERERKLAVGSGNDDKNSHNPSNDIGIDTKDEIVMPATSPPTTSTSTKVESNNVVKDLHSTSTAHRISDGFHGQRAARDARDGGTNHYWQTNSDEVRIPTKLNPK